MMKFRHIMTLADNIDSVDLVAVISSVIHPPST